MSSYRPKSYSRPLRRKKSRWMLKTLVFLLLAAVCWFVVPYVWKKVVEFFEPKYVTVVSNEEAVHKMNSVLSGWNMSNEDLIAFGQAWDEKQSWLPEGRPRQAAKWLLAQEYDLRGMWKNSHPVMLEILKKRIQDVKDNPGKQEAVLGVVEQWGDLMAARNDDAAAEKLYSLALEQKPLSEAYLRVLLRDIDLRNKQGDVDGVLALSEKLHQAEILKLTKTQETARKVARTLLQEDALRWKKSGVHPEVGEKLAYNLLTQAKLTNSPEMGRVLLLRKRAVLDHISSGPALSKTDNKQLRAELDQILVCFRADSEGMPYIPEVMMAMAKLYYADNDIQNTLAWLNRIEGAVLVLGVDTPRILKGASLANEMKQLRDQCELKLKFQAALQTLAQNAAQTNETLKAGNWKQAREASQKNIELAASTSFTHGYTPLFTLQLGRAWMGESNWSNASSVYQGLLNKWKALTEGEQKILVENMKSLGCPDFDKVIYRELAESYLKQNMVTKATGILAEIGETPPKKESDGNKRNTRNSR